MLDKIYVTGLGVVTPIGIDVESYWKNLCAGESNFTRLEPIYPSLKPNFIAGRISAERRLDIKARAPKCTGPQVPDSSLYAVDAALQAIADAGLQPGCAELRNALVCVGNNEAEADILDQLVEGIPVNWHSNIYSSHAVSDNVARAIGSFGPSMTIHNTCASANIALETALRMMNAGIVSTSVIGGGDAFSKKVWSGFYMLNALGAEQCRPFSKLRRFITISEGAAFLVLQNRKHVGEYQSPYAELISTASNNDALHPTNPDINSVTQCHKKLLDSAGVEAKDIGGIYAHGTGTKANDAVEASIFSEYFPNSAVSAIKGTIGHMMATAGAIGAVSACLSLRDQIMPPTNILPEDFEYQFNLITRQMEMKNNLKYIQNNAFGFGGNNAITLFGKVT
ncbi:beta-ketoacyl synthase N-terminal-like domain-containing protein [Photorhabdus namnaonensis]|uniref:3-oxoacyl-[acyl-carrier-protein] synthase 2 n=1 Tax=Photorhabdus namnaonensis TaxID=1851568 RepID=A0A1B8YB17_9GAMM|nr:beta-ketoacyl synthase N-terminal-like domain-containing protein [Photorhabdus namnaonensis]OCA52334.1 3-oxoacyl-[acyl-carrier-protein] synthase 2 [Photorhabdus namnaonensis]